MEQTFNDLCRERVRAEEDCSGSLFGHFSKHRRQIIGEKTQQSS